MWDKHVYKTKLARNSGKSSRDKIKRGRAGN